MEKKKGLSLAAQIFIAMVAAIVAGMLLQDRADICVCFIKPIGNIFLNLIKLIVVPVVLLSIVAGVVSMRDIKKVGYIGVRTVLYYLVTTAIAISIGLLIANLFRGTFPQIATGNLTFAGETSIDYMDTLVGLFPSNIISPLLNDNMLQIIVIALLIGFAIILEGEKAASVARGIEKWNGIFMRCMEMVLKLSPIGVFCLLCPVIAENGASILKSYLMVILCAYCGYIIHMAACYSAAAWTMGSMNPGRFFKGMIPAMLFAFSSASSMGTLPVNHECVKKLGASDEVSAFVLPLGATINMDGTAIYQGVCAVFIASCYGITLTLPQMITIVITATLASIGTAGVPGSGMVMLAMVLTSVGLPVEGVALVAGIDRILDMGRTVVNITGDASCAIVISHSVERREKRKNSGGEGKIAPETDGQDT